jgi:hypothetical protein
VTFEYTRSNMSAARKEAAKERQRQQFREVRLFGGRSRLEMWCWTRGKIGEAGECGCRAVERCRLLVTDSYVECTFGLWGWNNVRPPIGMSA